jgi:hypothetical protein
MTSSPASTVSSSELYPTSEPAEQEALTEGTQPQFGHGDRPSRPAVESQEPKFAFSAGPGLGSEDLNEIRRPKAAESDGASAASSITGFSETSNGDFVRTCHKRKRDGNIEYPASIQTGPVNTDLEVPLPFPNRAASVQPRSYTFDNNNIGLTMDERPSSKRTNSNDVTFRPVASVNTSQVSDLPIGIWQHVFCFVPPVFLGRLLRVNRAFNRCLTMGGANQQHPKPLISGVVKALSPEAVWAASRKRFCPGLPKPIRGLRELDMWRLLRGRHCQVCGGNKDSNPGFSSDNTWELGPGTAGVRVVWPWGVRLCGQCVQTHSEKVMILPLISQRFGHRIL